jgi:purine-binding chemotaxis protein CheW
MSTAPTATRPPAADAPATAGPARTFLTFRLGTELLAMEVGCVREILELCRITRVPASPAHMLGVVNVRGTATAVMDLRSRFGLPPRPPGPDARIIVMEFLVDDGLLVVGGLADAVREVVEISPAQISPPPLVGMDWPADLVLGVARRDRDYILLLDMARTLLSETPRTPADGEGRTAPSPRPPPPPPQKPTN